MTEYTGKKKVYMLILISVLSTLAFCLLSVITYYIIVAVVPERWPPGTAAFIMEGNEFRKAAVASNGYLCANIGSDVLKEGGRAVDAAIAIAICEGVMCLQSMGLGGGFLMTIYDKKTGKVEVLNARETAPLAASENMFFGNATISEKGGLAVAVPGELKGYLEAYKKYGGGVSWKRLFQPSIAISKNGFTVYKYLADHIERYKKDIMESPTLREILWNPNTKQLAVEGDLIRRPQLGEFLEAIAEEGITPFYSGRFAKSIVKEVKEHGGILTEDDLKNYEVQWMQPTIINLGRYKMYSSPVPGSGELLAFAMNILNNFIPDDDKVAAQRYTETFKWMYGRRTELGDISQSSFVSNVTQVKELVENLTSMKYANEIRKKIKDDSTSEDPKFYGAKVMMVDNHGTCHISVLAPNGDAVSITTTINLIFGAKFASKSTGIVFNDEMADFSAPNIENPFGVPPSPTNFIKPTKRPLSSMCPTIVLNENNDVELVVGASGGTRITSTVAYVVYNILMKGKGIKEAIDLPRIHHQLFPMVADYETGYPLGLVKSLQEIGHKTIESSIYRTSAATAVRRCGGKIYASYDYRRGGSVAGF